MIIDTHQHLLPPFYIEGLYDPNTPLAASGDKRSSAAEWTIAWTLAEMDQANITAAVLSLPGGVWTGNSLRSAWLARSCNEYAADLVRTHTGRLGMFATLPLPDVNASLLEVESAIDVLAADGFGLMSNYQGRWLGDPMFAPVLDELDRRRAVVFVHPTVAPTFELAMPGIPDAYIEYPFDTTRTIVSLLMSGALTRHRRIRFLFAHLGGAVAVLAERIARFAGRAAMTTKSSPVPVLDELRGLFYDSASNSNAPGMAALRALVPDTQIVFGSDAPFLAIGPSVAGMSDADLDERGRILMESGNALTLLPRFRDTASAPPS